MCCRRKLRKLTRGRGPSRTATSPIKICPEVGGLISPTAVRKVDLPAPLGPSRAMTSPRRTVIVASCMATTSVLPLPYTFFNSRVSIAKLSFIGVSSHQRFIGLHTHGAPNSEQARQHRDDQYDHRKLQQIGIR